jgi:hypothetical protein
VLLDASLVLPKLAGARLEGADAERTQSPLIFSLHVNNPFWLTSALRRLEYDPLTAGSKKMVIETILFLVFVVAVGALIVKVYEWRQDVLYGPYIGQRSERNRH